MIVADRPTPTRIKVVKIALKGKLRGRPGQTDFVTADDVVNTLYSAIVTIPGIGAHLSSIGSTPTPS